MNRAEKIKRHAGRRAAERYGEVPDGETLRRIARLVRRRMKRRRQRQLEDVNISSFPGAGTQRVIASLTVDGRFYRVVYEPRTRLIVTFLPAGARGFLGVGREQ